MENTKICNRCKSLGRECEKTVQNFYRSGRNKDGLQNNCKLCSSELVNDWQNNNRSKTNNVSSAARKLALRTWYAKNKDKHKLDVQAYNKEKYHSDPYYRLSKEIYRLVHRYNSKMGFAKFGSTFKMIGASSEEIRLYFRDVIDRITLDGKKHKLEQVVPTKWFKEGSPVDVVLGLNNLRVVEKGSTSRQSTVHMPYEKFVTIVDFLKPEFKNKFSVG